MNRAAMKVPISKLTDKKIKYMLSKARHIHKFNKWGRAINYKDIQTPLEPMCRCGVFLFDTTEDYKS